MSAFPEAARQLVRRLDWGTLAQLSWRHHGLGMLQAEFSEALRIHVWHPDLVSPGMAWPRCVHDHRFDLESAVVVGTIRDVVPDLITSPVHVEKPWERAKVYEIEHAKNQDRMVNEKGCSTATSAKLLGEVILTRYYGDSTQHRAGSSYQVKRRVFHTTEVDALAITVVHRSNFDDRLARVLCAPDGDVTAISGIVRDDTAEHCSLLNRVLEEAEEAVSKLGAP